MSPRLKFAAAILVLVAASAFASALLRHRTIAVPRVSAPTDRLVADGYDSTTLTIDAAESPAPRVTILGTPHAAVASDAAWTGDHWEAEIRAGVNPGAVTVRVAIAGRPTASVKLMLNPTSADTQSDGTPDFLRLADAANQLAFRRWFTYLAEAEYFQEPVNRPSEISDCAALIRFAYREALHAHDHAWVQSVRLPLPAFDSVTKYEYPFTPLGANLFRTGEGPYQPHDLVSGMFDQFADVKTIWRYNTHLVSRDLGRAEPGDLILYKQDTGAEPYHSMIYLGRSQLQPNNQKYVVYHTGPTHAAHGESPGEIRRLTVEELVHFPQAAWRPDQENSAFLGVYRWNILRRIQPFS